MDFLVPNQTIDLFKYILQRWEIHNIRNETILFWQPKNESFFKDELTIMEDKIERIIEHDLPHVNAHCYLSECLSFDDGVQYYYDKITVVFDCQYCNTEGAGLDKTYNNIENVHIILDELCPVCNKKQVLIINKDETFKIYKVKVT